MLNRTEQSQFDVFERPVLTLAVKGSTRGGSDDRSQRPIAAQEL